MLSRRVLLAGLPLMLAGCVSAGREVETIALNVDPAIATMYGPLPDERFPIPAVDTSLISPLHLRQLVPYRGPEQPGTLVVVPEDRFLYLVQENGQALRYAVGVGKEGMEWSGRATVGRKAEWPRWTPTKDMIARDPRNAEWANGMEPGLGNPLGARALYLYEGGRDTLYRIHGTNEPWTIGRAVSSGCIRMFNQDIIDLHRRVPVGTPVVVMTGSYTV